MLQKIKLKRIKQKLPKQFTFTVAINFILVLFQFFYVSKRLAFLNDKIPFWYTKPWGTDQLANKEALWIIPIIALGIFLLSTAFSIYAKTKFMRYGGETLLILAVIYNFILTSSLIRIIKIASVPFDPLVNPIVVELAVPFFIALFLVYLLAPKLIDMAIERGIVTNPTHEHPGMILKEPSARGGGVIVAVVFTILTIVFIPLSKIVIGLLVGIWILVVTGLADDIQNTKPFSKLKFMENPIIRLSLQGIATIAVIVAGVKIAFINNPFNGFIYFDQFTLDIGGTNIPILALIVTFVWIVWIINMMSWSNGVDGQYAGIVGITAIVIAILALRNLEIEPGQIDVSKMAVILAGASFGLLPFTWNPSKVLWGFTATVAGLIIATLSLLTQAKVSISIMAIMVPFLDAAITVTRRVLQGKSPLKGDRGHLHHLLLERGWSVKKISVFYWTSAAILGSVAIGTSDRSAALIVLTMVGLIAFPIIILNIANLKAKN